MPKNFPKGIIPVDNPREPVDGKYYYPNREIKTLKVTVDFNKPIRRRIYHLVLWRNTQDQAAAVGLSLKHAHEGLRYATQGITFYEDPKHPQTHKSVSRWGVYVRME